MKFYGMDYPSSVSLIRAPIIPNVNKLNKYVLT